MAQKINLQTLPVSFIGGRYLLSNIDYLVTWNCTHLANGEVIRKLMKINESFGVHTPIICTPEELMEV